MSRLSSISNDPVLKEFAQGVAQDAVMPVADFLAPTVAVSKSVGRYKKYTEKNRFRIPDTLRTLGGRATELKFEVADDTYNCEPHALDYPVDNLVAAAIGKCTSRPSESVPPLRHDSFRRNEALGRKGACSGWTKYM